MHYYNHLAYKHMAYKHIIYSSNAPLTDSDQRRISLCSNTLASLRNALRSLRSRLNFGDLGVVRVFRERCNGVGELINMDV
jgi:hypothetical protein